MNTQESYNEWFKSMVEKYLSNHEVHMFNKTHNDINYILATISHPEDSEKNINISTYGREITLFFWNSHSHHDSDEEDDHEQEFEDLTEYIEDIINDKVYFSSTYKGETVTSSMSSYDMNDHLKSNKITVIKSWSGRNDQKINNG